MPMRVAGVYWREMKAKARAMGVVGERFWGVLGALMGQVERVCEKDGNKKKMKKSLNGGRGKNVEASSLKGSGTKRKRGESDGECSSGPLGLESDA